MSTTRPYPVGGQEAEPPARPTDLVPGVPPARAVPAQPPRQVRRLALDGVPGAVSRARGFTRRALRDWGWLPAATPGQRAAAEDALLVVSELVTNACLHAGGPEELCLVNAGTLLRVEVADHGAGEPLLQTTRRAGRPGGHGMFIVQRLCLAWGTNRVPVTGRKTVWVELRASP